METTLEALLGFMLTPILERYLQNGQNSANISHSHRELISRSSYRQSSWHRFKQMMRAALLESTVTESDDVLPSFGQTLSQLTANEANYLSRLYAHVVQRQKEFNAGWDIGSERGLRGLYDERLRNMTHAEAELLKKERKQAQLAIDDLERLGIIAQRQEIEKMKISRRDIQSLASLSRKIQETELDSIYFFTAYGIAFIKCVTPSRENNTGEVS